MQPAGPGAQSPLRTPLQASQAHGAPHSHSCRHSGSELGLLGLSRWLICLFAAPWQEAAGEAGESSGQKKEGSGLFGCQLPGGTPSMRTARRGRQALENGGRAWHEEGGRGRKRRGGRGQQSRAQPTPQMQRRSQVPQAGPQAHVYTNHSRPGGYGPQGGATSAHAHLDDSHSPQAPTQGPSC